MHRLREDLVEGDWPEPAVWNHGVVKRLRLPVTLAAVASLVSLAYTTASLAGGPREIFRHWWSSLAMIAAAVVTAAAVVLSRVVRVGKRSD
jgi:hypothetical protein